MTPPLLGVQLRLAAPLAAWGDRIAGTIRPSAEVPTWSALVGLVSAALGYARGSPQIAEFAQDYAPAIALVRMGAPLVDYHTIQTAKQSEINAWSRAHGELKTRAEELEAGSVTTITHRTYWQDSCFDVWLVPVAPLPRVTLQALMWALNAPRYALYAGRRSCPFSEPINARLESVDTVRVTHWDARLGEIKPAALARIRHDLLVNAQTRSFADRTEWIAG